MELVFGNQIPSYTKEIPKGKVKIIKTYRQDIVFDKKYFIKNNIVEFKEKDVELKELIELNINSKIIEVSLFENSKIIGNYKNNYNSQGKLINLYSFDKQGTYKIVYTYDLNERRNKYVKYSLEDNILETTICNYDSYGKLCGETTFNSRNALVKEVVLSYDFEGNLKKEFRVYTNEKEFFIRLVQLYNTKNQILEEAGYHENGSLSYKTSYNYDVENKRFEQYWYSSHDILDWKFVSIFDKRGRKKIRTGYFYNSEREEKAQYIYKSDKSGNWIKKTAINFIFRNKQIVSKNCMVIYRDIDYFSLS